MNENDHPLARVLRNRNLEVRVNSVRIIEWLPRDERKTGAELAESLKSIGVDVELASCDSKESVIAAIRAISRHASAGNVPIVHIEAHGEEPGEDTPSSGFVGPNGRGGIEIFSWEEIGRELRPLNVSTKFNLIVVGAACYGEGLLLAIEPGMPVPFVLAVGYQGNISAKSLRDALLQFYRLLLGQKWSFAEALDAANREHHFDSDSMLRETASARLILEALCDSFHMRHAAIEMALGTSKADAIYKISASNGWHLHFALDDIPENKRRFEIDLDELIRVARRNPDWDQY